MATAGSVAAAAAADSVTGADSSEGAVEEGLAVEAGAVDGMRFTTLFAVAEGTDSCRQVNAMRVDVRRFHVHGPCP